MNKIKMVGMRHVGALRLWRGPEVKIGVFASRRGVDASSLQRDLWAKQQGKRHRCVVGVFHSRAEMDVLNGVLSNGGFGVWIRGCDFPKEYNPVCMRALQENRLLVISCFRGEHHTEATARYCTHLVAMCTRCHAYWLRKDETFLRSVCQRAMAWGRLVEVF